MTEAARLSDSISCGDVINEGSGDVFFEGLPVARLNSDKTAGHCYLPTILEASPGNQGTVFVNDLPVAMKDDYIDVINHWCGAPPNIHKPPTPRELWAVITGAATVFVYD